ncbi:MAG: FG-GAP-like repeat-containing protein, partial [Microcystis panniformis]
MNSTLLPILPAVYDVLFNFAQSDGFWANLETAFGTSYDVVKATQLRQQWQSRDFSQLPPITVQDFGNSGIFGAYSSSTNRIYISQTLIDSGDATTLSAVLLEEIGHFIDAQINSSDTPGDEGQLFSALVRGEVLTEEQIAAIREENDAATITVDGQAISVEMAFSPPTNFTVGNRPSSVTVGDFNGDGKSDLAVANSYSNNVSVLLGTGTGSFGPATNFTVGSFPRSVTVGDFNGDGKSDLATANRYGNVSVLLGTGTGSFGTATNFTVGSDPRSVTVGDFNGDGKSDLATANAGSNNVSVLLGTGTGSFGTATNFFVGSDPRSVTVGDFNSDGKSDVAVANYTSSTVSVLLGTGTGSFATATNFSVGSFPSSVTVGDFNSDGKSDLATANYFGNNVSVLLGTGTGSFGTATNFSVGNRPYSVTVGDFNGDGKSDLAVANAFSNNVSVLLNADPTATVTITDVSQPAISLTINDVTVTEGNSGTTNAVFTVSLSSAASTVVSVNYATANGTATAGTDYTAIPTTTLTFNPGETSKTITVAVNGDNQVELNETFFLNLSNLQANGSNVTLADNQGQGTINNDDSASIAITDVTVTEGNSGTTNAVFTVTLSNPIDTAITLNYATADGTATTADNDYTAIATTPLTFNAGETSKTITVAVNGDTKVESNETFFVNLSNLQTNGRNVTIADNQGQGTITDDDTLQSITILDFESPLPQGLSSVSFWQGTSVPSTAKITNQYAPSGVLMSGVALINHGLGHAASGVNGIGGIGLESSVDYDAPLTFQFVSSVNSSTPAYTNYFAISPDLWGGSGNNVKITAYGFDNTILGVTTYTETGNLSPSTPIEIQNVGKIYKVVVDASLAFVGGGGIGFDLVKFEVPTVDAPSITLAVAPASVTE